MIKRESVLVGSDFECPLMLVTGEFFPATGLFGGTKAKPVPIPKLPEGYFQQEDNVNAEFNIPPAKDAKTFSLSINRTLKAARAQLPPSIVLRTDVSVAEYRPEFLKHPDCQQFGCTPDYNAYTREENPRPRAKNRTMRTASAHIHVGWENPNNEDRLNLIKMMDITVGLNWIGVDDIRRKEMYGKAGAFRPKEYGVEYRVVDNKWLENGAGPTLVFQQVLQAVDLVNKGVELTADEEAEIQTAILTGQFTTGVSLIQRRIGLW
jgi:hypothetical protein